MKILVVTLLASLLVTVAGASAAVSTSGLYAAWDFNNATGTAISDQSGNGYNGVLTNGASITTAGKIQNATMLDGTNDFVNISNSASFLTGSSSFTILGWFRGNTTSINSHNIMTKPNSTSYEWFINYEPSVNAVRFVMQNTAASVFTAYTPAYVESTTAYTFFVARYNTTGSTIQSAISNSTAGGLRWGNATTFTGTRVTGTNGLTIGRLNTGDYFNGSIDAVQVFNRSLTDSEVVEIYNNFAGCEYPGSCFTSAGPNLTITAQDLYNTTSIQSFNATVTGSAEFISLLDKTGNGNNLTNNGATYNASSKSYNFNGLSNSLEAPASNIMNMSQEFSMCLWYSTNSSSTQELAGKYRDSPNRGYRIFYQSPSLRTRIGEAGTATEEAVSVPTDGVLRHVCAVANTTNLLLYVNNTLAPSPSARTGGAFNSTQPFYIGVYGNNASNRFNGSISDVRVWNRSLSAAEVATVYANGTVSDGLVAWYDFNDYGQANYTTTTGTIATGFQVNNTQPANVSVYANNYFSNTTENYNTTILSMMLRTYTAIRAIGSTGVNIGTFTINWINDNNVSETGNYTTTSSVAYAPLYNSDYTIDLYDASEGGVNFSQATATVTANPYLHSYNFTLDVAQTIVFYVREETNQTLITGINSTIYVTGTRQSYNLTTLTGIANVTMVLPDRYTITYSAPGYQQRQLIFTLVNQSSGVINLFLAPSDEVSIVEQFVKTQNLVALPGANLTIARKNLSGTNYYDIYSCTTDINGRCVTSVILNNADYRVMYSYQGFIGSSGDVQFTANDVTTGRTYIINLVENSLNTYFEWNSLGQLSTISFLPNRTSYNGTTRLTIDNNADIADESCIYLYKITGFTRELENSSCTTGTTISIDSWVNITNGGDAILAQGVVVIDGVSYVVAEDSINIASNAFGSSYNRRLTMLVVVFAVVLTLALQYTWNPIAPMIISGLVLYVFSGIGLISIGPVAIFGIAFGIPIIVMLMVGKST